MATVFTMSLPDNVAKELLEKAGVEKIQDAVRVAIQEYLNGSSGEDKLDKVISMLEDVRDGVDKIKERLGI